jgi:hypothetical protein
MKRLLVSLALGACLLCAPALAQAPPDGGLVGRTVTIAPRRPPMEPGRVFAGNDGGVRTQLLQAMARPAAETPQVIADMEAFGLDNMAPPMLLEYARRQRIAGNARWIYFYALATFRSRLDADACADRSARQFATVILMEFSNGLDQHDASGFKQGLTEQMPDGLYAAQRQVLTSGEMFTSKASAWWICSHGMSTMAAAIDGRAPTLEQWWAGEAEVAAAAERARTQIDTALREKGH